MRNLKAFIIIFLFDVLALELAFAVSGMLAIFISGKILGIPSIYIYSDSFINRIYIFTFMSAVALFSFYNRGHYRRRIPWWNQVRFISITLIMILLADGFLHFALKSEFSRLCTVLSWALSFIFILTGRVCSRIVCENLLVWKVPTIVIGSGENAIDTIFAIYSDSYTGYDIKTLILHNGYENFNRAELPAGYANINIVDGTSDYTDYLKSHSEYFYMIAPDSPADIDVEKLVETLDGGGSGYAIIPPVKGLALYGNTPQYFFGHDIILMQPRSRISSPFGRIVKRGVDIIGSMMLLVIFLPLFLIIYCLIKKEGGNVFFRNKRLGRHGKSFYCLKFRTMIPDAEKVLQALLAKDPDANSIWETHRKIKNDPRVTAIGKFLRKSSLDELPQLINIIKGEMSLVGPRPILPDEIVFLDKNQLASYYSVRPGITGLWQVSGRNDTSYKRRVHLDSWYVKNWSIWYDIVILFKTFTVLVRRSGAY